MKTYTKMRLVALFGLCVGGAGALVTSNFEYNRGFDDGVASLDDQMEIYKFYQKCNNTSVAPPAPLEMTLFYPSPRDGRTYMSHPTFTCVDHRVKRTDRKGPSTL